MKQFYIFILGLSMINNLVGNHFVTVILEAKAGKEEILKEELVKVMKLSKQEDTCIEYKVIQDVNNSTKFALNEIWTSKEDHAKQFQKPYILELGEKSEDLLAGGYQVVMGSMLD